MLPPTIPIFPLPNVVLFPNVFLPLHIFEPRYRAMVADALAGDRIIGMVLLQPGYEADYEGRPPVYPDRLRRRHHALRAAAGRPLQHRAARAREVPGHRRGHAASRTASRTSSRCPKRSPRRTAPQLRQHRHRLEALLAAAIERSGADPKFPPAVPDEDLVNALAQYLELEPLERQALLERDGVLARCRGLIELLEMKTMTPRGTTWKGRSCTSSITSRTKETRRHRGTFRPIRRSCN